MGVVVRSSGSVSLAVFTSPPLQLVLFLVLGAVTGILASGSGAAQGRGNSDE